MPACDVKKCSKSKAVSCMLLEILLHVVDQWNNAYFVYGQYPNSLANSLDLGIFESASTRLVFFVKFDQTAFPSGEEQNLN